MAAPGKVPVPDEAHKHLKEKVPEKQGLFSKMKDHIHNPFGFVSDVDSPAAQAALAELQEKEAREGPTVVEPQPPLLERVKDGINSYTDAAVEVSTGTSGGVNPATNAGPAERAEEAKESTDNAFKGESLGAISESNESGSVDKRHAVPATVAKTLEEQKQQVGKKETHSKAEKDQHSLSKWALNTAHKLGQKVASKDLSEELLEEKPRKK